MKINNKRKLQNIAINHSVDIDYKELIKIYRECAKEPLTFWLEMQHYHQLIPQDLEKICVILYKNDSNKSD